MSRWAASAAELVAEQKALAAATPPPWRPGDAPHAVGGCFVCFARGLADAGSPGDEAWAGAAVTRGKLVLATSVVTERAQAAYTPGLLALREGRVLEAAVRGLPEVPTVGVTEVPTVLLVNGTGRDHPHRAGLALHLGAVLDLPTVGVTHRPLLASGDWPSDERGESSPLHLDGEEVARWVRTRRGRRPLAAHPAWRTDLETATAVVLETAVSARTPEPLRQARTLARRARAAAAIV